MPQAISGDDCSAIIREFDAQGWHRTGTEVDLLPAEWFIEKLKERGIEGRILSFPFDRVDPEPCSVLVSDWSVKGHPLPDTNLPEVNAPIGGTFGDGLSPNAIALVRESQRGQSELFEETRKQDWKAIIAVTGDPETGLALRNSWQYDSPAGPAIAQVPAAAWERLSAAKGSRGASCDPLRCGSYASHSFQRVGRGSRNPP